MNKQTSKSIILCVTILFLSVGCSSIKIKKISLGKEVAELPNWKLSYFPIELDYTQEQNIANLLPSIENLNNSNQYFVQQILDELVTKYNAPFYSNIVNTGEIQIEIYNLRELDFPDTKYNVHQNEVKNKSRHPYSTGIQPTVLIDKDAPINRINSKIKVTYVSLYFYNNNKQRIGHIKIQGENLKPSNIAKIISKHISSIQN